MNTLLSIITLYNYDTTLFDNMVIPTELDKQLLIDNIMLELGELELLYNDPNMMKFAIERWSSKELKKWQKLYETTILEYDPIENYNRTEDFTDTETRNLETSKTETRNLIASNNETRNLQENNLETRDLTSTANGTKETTDNDVQGGVNTTTKEVEGFNSTTKVIDSIETQDLGATNNKTVNTTASETTTDTGTVDNAKTDTGTVNTDMTDTGTISDVGDETGTVELKKVGNARGNIGVTTTQQMIEQERRVLEFNIYNYIVESFKKRFCIMVY